ncbi:MAG: wax ester/triacylglycerol synthase family O-acyltransferase [Myxococcales bacterium]|nr:wax ester/triacylglycerol synthase family O-acyltransferase [Myxococcales bacterium]
MIDLLAEHPSLQEMSGLDAAFLYLETPSTPMHVSGLSIMEGTLTFDRFRQLLTDRLHLVPVLTRRLVDVPMGLDKPYWIDDPDFNLDWHVHHSALPAPGDWGQLRSLCSRIFSQPLDRSRPLWEMVLVEGLDSIPQIPPGSVAVINKIHHACIDGMSGADIVGMLFDVTREPRVIEPPKAKVHAQAPTDMEVLAHTAKALVSRPKKLPRLFADAAKAFGRATALAKAAPEAPPTLPFQAPPTPLNRPISSNRLWNVALLELHRVKRLKRLMGCTVNDVVLAICAGALRNYLESKGQLPNEPLVTMVPVSTRSKAEKNTMGNQVSAMFIQLATNIKDPVERLRRIHTNASVGKTYQGAVGAKNLVKATEFVPFGLAGQAARAYSRSQLAQHHRPIFNCVITNVPGPQVPLYLNGSQLLAQMGSAPILDGMGLMLVVTSYNGVLAISPTSSPAVMPDLDDFNRMLWESANELEAAINALGLSENGPEIEAGAVKAVFDAAKAKLDAQPDLELPATGVYRFEVTGQQAQVWTFRLEETRSLLAEDTDDAICSMRMGDHDFLKLAAGKLDGPGAFMSGKLKVKGDIKAAIGFGQVLAKLAG